MTTLVIIIVVVLFLPIIAQLRRAIHGTLPKQLHNQPPAKHPFTVHIDREYIPVNVQISTRPISKSERKIQRKLLGLVGHIKRDEQVVVLRMRVFESWYLYACNPDCCPPGMLLRISDKDYLFVDAKHHSHGLTLFTDENGTLVPLREHIELVRTMNSHLPLQLIQWGGPVVHHNRNRDKSLDLSSFEGSYCEFVSVDRLPLAFTHAFSED